MTHRERQTPDRGNGPTAVPSGLPVAKSDGTSALSSWEALFLSSSQARREELLARAADSGIVYAHRLANGSAETAASRTNLAPAVLLLQNGGWRELPAVTPEPIEIFDQALDTEQREAVARAMSTPDVCLIAGAPGTGKSRVVLEILSQAIARGQRVLFLAPGTAAVDHVLEALARRESACPVRLLGSEEAAESLSPGIRQILLDSRARHFREHTLPRARAAADEAQVQVDALRREQATRQRLAEISALRKEAIARRQEIEARLAALVEEVIAASSNGSPVDTPFGAEVASEHGKRDDLFARLDAREAVARAEQEKIRSELNEVESQLNNLHLTLKNRLGFRIWSAGWWLALRQSNVQTRVEQLEARKIALETEITHRRAEAEAIASERAQAEAEFRAALNGLVHQEAARRSVDMERERSEAAADEARWCTQWDELAATLEPTISFETEDRPEDRIARELRLAQAEQVLTSAAEWARAVEMALPDICTQLIASADVLAAAIATFSAQSRFETAGSKFDLLVLEEADRITEADFHGLSRFAARWVLVGEPEAFRTPAPANKTMQSSSLKAAFFHRAWETLHADPRRLPYAWYRQSDGRLCCRLRTSGGHERSRIESESVADRPEIELRIATLPRSTPQLYEVVFPAETDPATAKAYLFSELDELPLQSAGRTLRWAEESNRLYLWFDSAESSSLQEVAICEGVSELIGSRSAGDSQNAAAFLTYALAFDRATGWTRESAAAWTAQRLGIRDAGRTYFLSKLHRMEPGIAQFVRDLLNGERDFETVTDATAVDDAVQVEFVPVPSLLPENEMLRRNDVDSRRRNGGTATAPRLRTIKSGAGLETELSDARRPDSLPADLRELLPSHGLVNYLEARTLVNDLEALVVDPQFQSQALRWTEAESGWRGSPSIAVIALYPSQAELIRQLIARIPAVSASPLGIEIGTPDQFQQRECLAAFISLTRSHQHRPVSYGDGPDAVALACTRARSRVRFYGDPGTLARRSQCPGPIDHLDAAAADRERALVLQLVTCLHSQGSRTAIRVREGTGL